MSNINHAYAIMRLRRKKRPSFFKLICVFQNVRQSASEILWSKDIIKLIFLRLNFCCNSFSSEKSAVLHKPIRYIHFLVKNAQNRFQNRSFFSGIWYLSITCYYNSNLSFVSWIENSFLKSKLCFQNYALVPGIEHSFAQSMVRF